MKFKILFFAAAALFLFSCRSVPTDIAYFQDFDAYVQKNQPGNSAPYEPSIRSNDYLSISVSSPVLDQTQVAQFNLPLNTHLVPGETMLGQSPVVQTYIVDKDGYINFPVLGKLKLAGLTRSQAVELIARQVADYVPNPIVNLQIISFKVTVLGEVFKPGPVVVSDERVTIFDAIGAVGDLTIYGDRTNVILARENNGIKELHKLDLTKTEIFNSPYYYLQQNDVLYVEPNNTKKRESNFGAGENYTLSILSISFTAVSLLVSFLGIYMNNKK